MYATVPTPKIPLLQLPESESPPPEERRKITYIYLLLKSRRSDSFPPKEVSTTIEGVYEDIEDAYNALRRYANNLKKTLGKDLKEWKPHSNMFSGRVSCEVVYKDGERVELEVRRKEVEGKGSVEKCKFD